MANVTDVAAPEVGLSARGSDTGRTNDSARLLRQDRVATAVFGAYVAIAAGALVLRLGRHFWFHGDEWYFLVLRDGGNLSDIFRAHNEHIQVLPVLAYRAMWNLFGLRSYVPYQIPVITLHLTSAVLLRAIMRRCDVNPWIATAAASTFVLFGPGEENIVWAFQIGFTGSLAFGLAHLLLADHTGPFDRRDWFGLAAGAVALLSSGFTPIITAVVGAVVLVHRGWRPALFHVVPLAVAYLTWWVTIGPNIVKDPYNARPTRLGDVVHFVKSGVTATFEGLGGNAIVAWTFGIVLVVGLAVAWLPLPRTEVLARAVMPLGLLVAGLGFLVVSGYGRWWFGPNPGASSRYVHLVAAFTLPALAIATDALVRYWRPGVIVAVVVFAAVIPQGIRQFGNNDPWTERYFQSRERLVAALGQSEFVTQVPRATRPDALASPISAGWLLDAREAGDLPLPDDPTAADNPIMRLRFGLSVIDAPGPSQSCETVREPVDVTLSKGDELGVYAAPSSTPPSGFAPGYTVRLLENGVPVKGRLGLHPNVGHLLRAELDDLHLRFAPAPGVDAFVLCH